MKPGRELDAEIAEKVMGISREQIVDAFEEGNDTLYSRVRVRRYSTDISAAWEVVEKLLASGQKLSFNSRYDREIGAWVACFYNRKELYLSHDDPVDGSVTAPHAICLAALKAVAP